MPFAQECFWAVLARATFCSIFEKFPLVPPFHFLRKCGFWVTLRNCHNLASRALFESLFCLKIFSNFCFLSAYELEDNAICARVLLGVTNEGYFLGDFWKISLGFPFALFKKMQVLGDVAKSTITWPFGHFCSRLLAPKFSPVFAL